MSTRIKTSFAIEDLKCTPKALEQVQSYANTNELSGRERQCLILMMRNDELSLIALNRFIEKIDIPSLIQRGYLTVISDTSDTQTIDNSSPVMDSSVLPGVALLSGNLP